MSMIVHNIENDNPDNTMMIRGMFKQLYQEIEATKEYQETYWYGVRYETDTKDLIKMNKFWCAYAEYLLGDDEGEEKKIKSMEFLSKWVLLPTTNIHEIICCLAVLNLSFDGDGLEYETESGARDKSVAVRMINNEEKGNIVFIKQLVI